MLKPLIVVTDLDGTLLDHWNYAYEAARPALTTLAARGIPLVLSSSKTAAELLALRRALGNREPFVVENGGGLYLPRPHGGGEALERIVLGRDRADILAVLNALRAGQGWRFTGFADMSAADVARHTGLSVGAAQSALQRDFSEPLLWQDSEPALADFAEALQRCGLALQRGGRFLHVSAPVDKGTAMPWLRRHYGGDAAACVIALGDADNDRAMLEAADHPIVVRSPAHPPPRIQHPRVRVSDEEGPAGWNSAVLSLLEELQPGTPVHASGPAAAGQTDHEE